ncbi:MAG: Asp-tRNA(Asn)/Glu-tRNA(Gln) amidotransferase subunit GatC [bacterium]|nr:Asp-tRNA(Asn)/Glu-tRNA(Gln) amidotransferase subunit GatC [bacterium]
MVDIEKLALLARIKLESEEKEKLQKEFGEILDYISELKEADVSGVEEETGNAAGIENVLREDDESHEAGEFSEDLLKNAPEVENGYIKVKHILK